MKPKKTHILYYFLMMRWSRIFNSNHITRSRKRRWAKNLLASAFYKPYLTADKQLPIMNKSIFMEQFDQINTVGITKEEALQVATKSEQSRDFTPSVNGISVGLSSGTSGNKGIFLTTPREKAIWVAAILDRVIGLSWKKRKVAFFLRANNNLYESVKSKLLSFTFFDIKQSIEHHIESLIQLDADIMVAQPSVLLQIARHYEQHNIVATFTKVISVAEVLESDQKAYFEQVFRCPIHQVYQCTEGLLAYTCSAGQLHFNEDWLKIEKKYIDADETRFHPIITDYLRASQPVVRYELNDIIQEGPRCTCGSKSTVIKKIEGRSDDVFHFDIGDKEVVIYPDFIRRAIVLASDDITNYQVTRTDKYTVTIYLEAKKGSDLEQVFRTAKDGLTQMFTDFGIVNIEIKSTTLHHEAINKFTRIKNEYSKNA